ncbi:MAG TPA: hypothetical protein VE988_09690 [Gemmataceae bacterium]|nr:hypothetical protein [Gemmataceae bacterium]
MKRLFIVLVLVGVGVVGLGFYRGWFRIGSDNADGKSNITLSMDGKKFQEDEKKALANVQGVGNSIKDKVAGPAEKSMDGTMVSVSGDKLTMIDKEGKEHGHPLAANVKVTCDGKNCLATDLKAGMKIRVTTDAADRQAATRIEALDRNLNFDAGT